MRINKFIASCGLASRRKADDMIQAGRVTVNRKIVRTLGVTIDPEVDQVEVDGTRCTMRQTHIYLALHKPAGFVCTHARFRNERSIFTLVPQKYRQLKMAGRLDKDSSGLVILSDDGAFVQELMHPKYRKEKEYVVTLARPLSRADIAKLQRGIFLDEGRATADHIRLVRGTTYRIILHQGWKRQIRRMMDAVHAHVNALQRVRVDNYMLGTLAAGKYKALSKT